MQEYISTEKTIQFNVVNTTSSPIFIDLFNINILTNTPTQPNVLFPENTQTGEIIQPTNLSRQSAINTINNNIYITSESALNDVNVYDSNNNFITNIPIGGQTSKIVYNENNNSMYVIFAGGDVRVFVIDCNTNVVVSNIVLPSTTNDIVYNSINNTIYTSLTSSNQIAVIDCNTNTISTLIAFNNPQTLGFNANDNTVYVNDNTSFTIDKIDCSTNTIVVLGINYVANFQGIVEMVFNEQNNTLYAGVTNVSSIVIIDTLTDTLIQQLPISFTPASNLVSLAFNSNENLIYISPLQFIGTLELLVLDCSTNTVINTIPVIPNITQVSPKGLTFNPNNNLLYISTLLPLGRVLVFTTESINSNPFYISSSGNYNEFLQSLESEPISLNLLKIVSLNQNQLSNSLRIKTIDADGQDYSYSKTPILQVSSYQKQGNISDIKFSGLILDGRTFFSNYKIEPNENVVLEMNYIQINRFSIKKLYDNEFKKTRIIDAPQEINKINSNFVNLNLKKSKIVSESDKIEITVTNSTANASFFDFFQANQNQLIINTPSVSFSNIDAYNYLVQQVRDSPLVLNAVEIIVSNQEQLNQPVLVRTKDANGDRLIYSHLPNIFVDSFQKDSERSLIVTSHLVIDGYTTFPQYLILPNTTITCVLYYKQWKRSDFLKKCYFPILKKPIFSNGMDLSEEIEYYNEVSEGSINYHQNGKK